MLTKIRIENYKSLHDVEIDFPPFAAFVGPNAAGKSNLMDALEFLSIMAKNGLPSAVSDKGGYENICFRRARRAKGAIRFHIFTNQVLPYRSGKLEVRFDFSFSFRSKGQSISSQYVVEYECLRVSCRDPKRERPWENKLLYEASAKKFLIPEYDAKEVPLPIPPYSMLKNVFDQFSRTGATDELLLTSLLRGWPPFSLLTDLLSAFRVFQIMPSHARRPAAASGSSDLGKLGENLPAALQGLQREWPNSFHRLLDHLRLAVPTVEDLELDYVVTRELGLFLKEEGIARKMYASELSDGTVRTIALFMPLVDPRLRLVAIEEPENSIHPWATRQFVLSCREHSEKTQVLLTTHSPVLVSELEIGELFIVDRINGETQIRRASTLQDAINIVSGGVMGLGEFWDSGAIGGVPTQLSLPLESKK